MQSMQQNDIENHSKHIKWKIKKEKAKSKHLFNYFFFQQSFKI